MRAVLPLLLTACGFSAANDPPDPTGTVDAKTDLDAATTPDSTTTAPADAPQICSVRTASTTGTDRGQVGANGGSVGTTLQCNSAADRVIGAAVRMSNQNTTNGGRSAYSFLIQCATVTVGETVTVGTPYMREVAGTGQFQWTPATLSTTATCQPGWIVSGIHGHRGSSDDLFVNVSIRCSQILPTGQIGMTEMRYITGSLTDNNNADNVDCNANEVLVRLPTRTGAGLDAVSLSCSTPTCQ